MAKELTISTTDNFHTSKSPPGTWLNSHTWYIAIMMIVCSMVYYMDIILDIAGLPSPGWNVFLIDHELHLLLFSIPLLYTAYVYRVRGIIITGVILILIFVPRAIFSVPYLEPFFRAVVFAVFAFILGILIAYVQTRRDQAVEAYAIAKQSEERFQTLFDAMSEGVVLMDDSGRILKANPATEHILGLKHSEIEELSHDSPKLDTIHANGNPLSLEEIPISKAIKEKRPVMGDVTGIRHSDGGISWFIVNAIPLFSGISDLSGVVATFIDITARKEAERQLMIAETAIRTCVSAIATTDLSGRLTYVNPIFLEIWGYNSSEEMLGMNVTSLCKEEEKAQRVLQSLLANKDAEAAELVGKKKDGTEFIVGLKASLIIDADGQEIGITASMADITGRMKAKEKKS